MEGAFVTAAVIGFVELLRRLQTRDWFAAASIAGSGVIGALCGIFSAPGTPDVWTGIVLGLSASGFITLLGRAGSGTTGGELQARLRSKLGGNKNA
jgi:hypothetical protein